MASERLTPLPKDEALHRPASDPIDLSEPGRSRRRLGDWHTTGLDYASLGLETPASAPPQQDAASDERPIEAPSGTLTTRLNERRLSLDSAQTREPAIADATTTPRAPVSEAKETKEAIEASSALLNDLMTRVQANPADVDALAELARLLHERGMETESLAISSRLSHLHQTQSLPTRSAAQASPQGVPNDQTPDQTFANRPSRPRRGTSALAGAATAVLSARLASFPSASPSFSIEALGFTVPLPGEVDLPPEARLLIEQSGEEVRQDKLMAAFDSCIQAIELVPEFTPVHIRIAEIYARQHSARRALQQAEAIIRLSEVSERRDHAWMAFRIRLHASTSDLDALKQLVESLMEVDQPDRISRYGSKLVQLYVDLGQPIDALVMSERLCERLPGDAQAALENALLRIRTNEPERAIDRWEQAVAAGANPSAAKASLAALVAEENERDHWLLLADTAQELREGRDASIADAYRRTASVLPVSHVRMAGNAIVANLLNESTAEDALLDIAGQRDASRTSRTLAAVSLAHKPDSLERISALRTSIALLQERSDIDNATWNALVGGAPCVEELEVDLGRSLIALGDVSSAIDVLKRARIKKPGQEAVSQLLADAYVRAGQLGSALAVLDELAIGHRAAGRLDVMAAVLRQMSVLAPNNIKVKSRLVDAFLQRGFVEEAKAELLARADLEEHSGLMADAAVSLQRAGDLSWSTGKHEESLATYRRLVALAPDDVANRSTLVNLYLQLGRISDAAEQQRAVVEISTRTGSPHEVIAALHQVIGLTPDDASAYYQLGELLQTMGEHHQAEKVFKRLVLMDPADSLAREKVLELSELKNAPASRSKAWVI